MNDQRLPEDGRQEICSNIKKEGKREAGRRPRIEWIRRRVSATNETILESTNWPRLRGLSLGGLPWFSIWSSRVSRGN